MTRVLAAGGVIVAVARCELVKLAEPALPRSRESQLLRQLPLKAPLSSRASQAASEDASSTAASSQAELDWIERAYGTVFLQEDETPDHPLGLEDFWIGRYPVSNAQYGEFVAGRGYWTPPYWVEAQQAGAWQPGSITFWDNRCTMHRARPFDTTKVRDLRRVTTRDVASTLEQAA